MDKENGKETLKTWNYNTEIQTQKNISFISIKTNRKKDHSYWKVVLS